MATDDIDEIQAEAPPPKRARFEQPAEQIDTLTDIMDDIYSTATNTPAAEVARDYGTKVSNPSVVDDVPTLPSGIPGLGLLGQAVKPVQESVEQETKSDVVLSNRIEALQSPPINTGETPDGFTVHVSQGPVCLAEGAEGPETIVKTEPEAAESPSVTTALEALLGGLNPPGVADVIPKEDAEEIQETPLQMTGEKILDLGSSDSILKDTPSLHDDRNARPALSESLMTLQNAEEALQGDIMDSNMDSIDQQGAEFEIDSSPIESSSDDSDSDDSSSSEDSDEEDGYKLLDPEEQARILMEGDGGSDDEGGKGARGSGAQLRTKNEVPEEVIPKPDVTITPEMKIEVLGVVEGIVESILLIKARTSGEYRVLESGSVLCLADRTVIGVVSETLGRVQQPLYSVRFTNADEIKATRLVVGTNVYYSEQHSTYVFTQALKAYKGSDASNLHDEEVGDEEIEFSDDEAEVEHKRRIKQKRQERRGGRMQPNGGPGKGGHPLQQQQTAYDPSVGLSYDDEDEGLYKPLSRPAGFAELVGRREAPQEGVGYANRPSRDGRDGNTSPQQSREVNGRGRGGRSDRGRGRSDRGRGRGGFQDRRNDSYKKPPQDNRNNGYTQPPQTSPMPQNYPPSNYSYNQAAQDQYNPQQPHYPVPYPQHSFQQQQPFGGPNQYQHAQPFSHVPPQQPIWPNAGQAPQMPAGAFINPAFFGNQQHPPAASGQPWATNPQQHRNLDAERAFQEAQERLNILRNLGGSQ